MNKQFKYSLFLAAICAIAGILLASLNSFTAPIIKENTQKILRKELSAQFPYPEYEDMTLDFGFNDNATNDIQACFYAKDENGDVAAVIYRTSFWGYQSYIVTLVAIKVDGTIENAVIVKSADTYDSTIKEHDFNVAGSSINAYEFTIKAGITVTSEAVGQGIDAAVKHYKAKVKGNL